MRVRQTPSMLAPGLSPGDPDSVKLTLNTNYHNVPSGKAFRLLRGFNEPLHAD